MTHSERRDELRSQLESRRAQLEATSAKIEAKAGRNLFLAIGSGVAFGVIFLVSLFAWKPVFLLFIAVLVSVASIELSTAFRISGRRVPRIGAVISGLLIVAGASFAGASGMLFGLFAGIVILTLWRALDSLFFPRSITPRTFLRDVVSGLFVLVYVPFLGSIVILLLPADRGEWWIFSLVLIVVSVDVGAYAAGVTLGKHKMTPRISPNKTWEGFAGAASVAGIAGVLVSVLVLDQPWWIGVILGLMVLLTATGGDLTESLIKRNLGVKDMSTWIPGHGGFLDRLDSLLPSTIAVYGVALATGVLSGGASIF